MPVELARELVRIPSENPPGDERAVAAFVHDWFAERDVPVHLIESPEAARPSVAAVIGEGTPQLALNAHTDVVPADDPTAWTHDPFDAVVEDGRLYGRGSADTKASLAIAMRVAEAVRPAIEADELPGSLVVHAPAGEETGYPGTAALIEAGFGGDLAIVLEPTACRVATSAKGVATFRLHVDGRASHASRPDDADSAVDALRVLLDAVERYDATLRERSDPLVGRSYATVTEVAAGLEQNLAVVPDHGHLLLDRRLLPGESLATVEEELDDLAREVVDAGVSLERELVQLYEPAAVAPDHPLADVLRHHGRVVAGASGAPYGLEAATDARSFVAEGIDAVVWGPGRLAEAHTVDESIAVTAIERGYEVLRRSAREVLADPSFVDGVSS
ncbi:MAG: M20 family metallopeptidase [Halobacteriales archaeon]